MAGLEGRVKELIDKERQAATELAETRDWVEAPGEAFVILQGIVKGLEDAVAEVAREVDRLRG